MKRPTINPSTLGRPVTPDDLRDTSLKAGYRYVHLHKVTKKFRGQINTGGTANASLPVWRGPYVDTDTQAVQDVCDYLNGQAAATPAALATHAHSRRKPKRKVQRTEREKRALKVLREEAAKRKVEQANYVYLVGMEDNPEFVKIGEAFDPEDRYIGGQTFNPYTLVLLGYFKTDIPRDADKVLHREYAQYHHKAEWFVPADAILARFGVTRADFLRRCGGTTLKEVEAA